MLLEIVPLSVTWADRQPAVSLPQSSCWQVWSATHTLGMGCFVLHSVMKVLQVHGGLRARRAKALEVGREDMLSLFASGPVAWKKVGESVHMWLLVHETSVGRWGLLCSLPMGRHHWLLSPRDAGQRQTWHWEREGLRPPRNDSLLK